MQKGEREKIKPTGTANVARPENLKNDSNFTTVPGAMMCVLEEGSDSDKSHLKDFTKLFGQRVVVISRRPANVA